MSLSKNKFIATHFSEWLEENHTYLDKLRSRKTKLTVKDTQKFYDMFIQSDFFSDRLIISIKNETILSDDPNFKRVEMWVMEPTADDYRRCSSPINPEQDWIISCIYPTHLGLPDYLYSCEYSATNDPTRMHELLTVIPTSFNPIDVDLNSTLRQIGGESLLEAVESRFGLDIEAQILDILISLKQEEIKSRLDEEEKVFYEAREALKAELDVEKRAFNEAKEGMWTELDEVQKKISKLEYELIEKKRELVSLRETQEKLRLYEYRIQEIMKELDFLSGNKKQILDMINGLRSAKSPVIESSDFHTWNPNTAPETFQSLFYHNENQALFYPLDKVELFLRAIQTNSLLILNGPSGTGKSSLVHAFANAIKNARVTNIPVQSNWTDKQDLLGYFIASEKIYISTPFLEAILSAEYTDGIHFICLDEMNLSHIEYYFAELLSTKEQKNAVIHLYPDRYFEAAVLCIEEYQMIEHPTREEKEEYRNALSLISYPSSFRIPENVRLVGTLNMDQTVKPLSPKVIDRSFILELDHVSLDSHSRKQIESMKLTGKIEVSLEQLTLPRHDRSETEPLADRIVDLSTELVSIPNARINSRGRSQMISFLQFCELSDYAIDLLLQAKLLPRIHFSNRDQNHPSSMALNEFAMKIEKYPNTFQRLEKMKSGNRYITYFK